MFDFDALAKAMRGKTVLCVGDLMLDEFVYGDVSRISPEAPAPVMTVQRSEVMIGGAGNVARNIAAFGAGCLFVGVVGDDEPGRTLRQSLEDVDGISPTLICDAARPTTRKVRFVSEHFSTHMLRADWETAAEVSAATEQALLDAILPLVPRADIVLLSDYAKGVLTPRLIREVIDAAKTHGRKIVVDPKRLDFRAYRGATILTPNQKEFAAATRMPSSAVDFGPAAREAMETAGCEAILVTQSENGMTLIAQHAAPVHVPAYPVKVRDVSGAGDTVAATLAVAMAAGANWDEALRIANAAAAVAVAKNGTAVVTVAELRRIVLPDAYRASEEKIAHGLDDLDARLALWRADDLRIGFTNGCFDILHPGHVKVLTAARAACDRLIVGLNSDASVKRLKGASRPLQSESARAEVLAALEAVDLVVVFGTDTPIDLIARILPRVLVKGGDYTHQQVVGHDIVESAGGEVLLVEIAPGHSTTSLVSLARTGTA